MNSALANRLTLVFSFIGIFVAGVMSLASILGVNVPCGLNSGCEMVAHHPSSAWFGIKVSYIGLAAYTAFALLAILRAYLGCPRALVIGGLILSGIGAAVHVGLAIYAFTVINATCYWCLASLVAMILLFVSHGLLAQAPRVAIRAERVDLVLTFALAVLALGGLGQQGWSMYVSGGATPVNQEVLKRLSSQELVPADAHVYGDPNAPVVIVEFGDLMCPGCKESYTEVKRIVDDNAHLVRLVFRHFPLVGMPGHEMSWPAAVLAEYAGDHGRFWQFIDMVYATPTNEMRTVEDLGGLVTRLGLDAEEADKRRLNPADSTFTRVYDDFALASKLGIMATPTYIVVAQGVEIQVANANTIEALIRQPRYHGLGKANGSP